MKLNTIVRVVVTAIMYMLLPQRGYGQPTLTHIVDTLRTFDGNLFSGNLTITGVSFTAPSNIPIIGGSKQYRINNGVLNISLVPNDTATPSGTSYVLSLSNGVQKVCTVPTSGSPLTLSGANCTDSVNNSGGGGGGSGSTIPSGTIDQLVTGTVTLKSLVDCVSTGGTYQYSTATHLFTCHTILSADIPNLAESKITNLTTDLAAKAPTASPAFTGNVAIGVGVPTGLPANSLALGGASYMASGKVFVNASDTDPADYTTAKSGITVVNQAGNEVMRIWGTIPDTTLAAGVPCATFFGCMNLYIGWHAGFNQQADNTEAGYRNMGIGIQALNSITSGFDNFGIGTQALYNLTEGSDNQAYGYQVLYSVTTGQRNTGNGNSALRETTGDSNTAMGAAAGQNVSTGSNNTFLGADADVSGCGSCQNSAGIGANASVTVSNRMVFGDSNVTDVFLGSETALAKVHAGGGTATKLVCWKSDGKTLGWATMVAGDISACN